MTIRSYRDLEVWQLAMQLAHAAYDSPISSLRSSDMYCCRRFAGRHSRCQAISLRGEVASTRGDFLNFLSTSRRSVQELETYLLFANQRNYLTDAQLLRPLELADHVSRKLSRLRQTFTAHLRRAARGSGLARTRR